MKYEMIPEINIGILADEIKFQYNIEPDELVEELSFNCPFQFYYDEKSQKKWKQENTPLSQQSLLAASIFEDIFPDWDYIYITKY